MQTLILPGYSASNKTWVDELANSLKTEGLLRPFYWMHWTDENSKFNSQEKADLIAKHIRGDKVNIIAKSMGTLIASLVYKLVPDQIEKIILCGIPLNSLDEDEKEVIKSCLGVDRNRFVVYQNINDPHGGFNEVKEFGNVIMTNRDDHEYPFYEEFNTFLGTPQV